MNARTRLAREIVRRRRRALWPDTFTRITTPNGVKVRVRFTHRLANPWRDGDRATYFVPGGHVFGPWPPTPDLIRELGRWA